MTQSSSSLTVSGPSGLADTAGQAVAISGLSVVDTAAADVRLREASQLIIITHQKRTMEIADALYGVSMRQDGVSAVVGQRIQTEKRQLEPSPA